MPTKSGTVPFPSERFYKPSDCTDTRDCILTIRYMKEWRKSIYPKEPSFNYYRRLIRLSQRLKILRKRRKY